GAEKIYKFLEENNLPKGIRCWHRSVKGEYKALWVVSFVYDYYHSVRSANSVHYYSRKYWSPDPYGEDGKLALELTHKILYQSDIIDLPMKYKLISSVEG
ncbi:MAG: hypothetical protein AAF599_09575, partial [Bacteroidota bacterium]